MLKRKTPIEKLSVDTKIEMLTGIESAWATLAVEEYGIPSLEMHDGPNGLRRGDKKSTCFPSGSALACTFDEGILYEVGSAIGGECLNGATDLLLAPSINIKRTPLCGRNFEYYSEDPFLTGVLATSFVKGLQKTGVGACVKHFCANNQETYRMTVSSEIEEKTLREIYLKAFEMVVKNAKPIAIMASYNRVNGEYTSENKKLLTDILREEWGFDGMVISDWGGVNERDKAAKAGLDLEMPRSLHGLSVLRNAYKDGKLDLETIDCCATNIVKAASKVFEMRKTANPPQDAVSIATKAAQNSVVLLKNEKNILPLQDGIGKKFLVVGDIENNPRVQGAGCARTDFSWITDFIEELRKRYTHTNIEYQKGYDLLNNTADLELQTRAIQQAKEYDVVIYFLATSDKTESEGYDREDLFFPKYQLDLLQQLYTINENIVVIMQNGSVMDVSFQKHCKGLLESYFLGSAWGSSLASVISGEKNPNGKLAESFPCRLEDTPAYLNFPGDGRSVRYAEGKFVGYRYYQAKKLPVAYPFGFGLSYTKFKCANFKISNNVLSNQKQDSIYIECEIINVGDYDGAEVLQLYMEENFEKVPYRQLKAFQKVLLNKGKTKKVSFALKNADFEQYDVSRSKWLVKEGKYKILLGTSCEDILWETELQMKNSLPKTPCTKNSRIGELLTTKRGEVLVQKYLIGYCNMAIYGNFNADIQIVDGCVSGDEFFNNIMQNMPLHVLCNFSRGLFTEEKLEEFIKIYNEKY